MCWRLVDEDFCRASPSYVVEILQKEYIANVGVEASNPFARSKFAKEIRRRKPMIQGLSGHL